jgi:hypothetical protein
MSYVGTMAKAAKLAGVTTAVAGSVAVAGHLNHVGNHRFSIVADGAAIERLLHPSWWPEGEASRRYRRSARDLSVRECDNQLSVPVASTRGSGHRGRVRQRARIAKDVGATRL